ncbi:MAG: hypothetical protein JRI23_01195 [Deltaproteobacteria bacterium]|nr:hypothetical protein [Deltaproteobacteria bacterium]MBW2530070.1 hypothetical protein [Deltaproteobacteria bacterium]
MTQGDSGGDEASFDELVEIERATALIQGRDPGQAEAVVAARLRAKSERKKREEQLVKLQEAAERKRRARKRRTILLVVLGLALAASAYPTYNFVVEQTVRNAALRKLLDEASRAANLRGFKKKDEWLDVGAGGVSTTVPKATCSAVVAVREDGGEVGPIRIERQKAKVIEGVGGHIWCSCDDEQITVRPSEAPGARLAVRWLTTGTVACGGIDVLQTLEIEGFQLRVDNFGSSCANEAFEAWTGKRANGRIDEVPDKPAPWLAPLLEDGFALVGWLPAERTFGVVDTSAGQCMLVTTAEQEVTAQVRAQSGKPASDEAASSWGWCAYGESTRRSVWRAKGAPVPWAVLSIDAEALGGMAGLRGLAARRDLRGLEGLIATEELADDAKAALLASSVAKDTVAVGTDQGLGPKTDHRVIAFSMLQAGAYVADETSLAPMGCHPMPDPEASLNAFVCVQARPQPWRPEGSESSQAAASAKLPFWLSLMNDATDPKALQAAAQALGFARRMSARGCEPSSAFGVKDEAWGATVRGHANKKTVAALGITKTAPWVHPLTAGEPWTLDGPVPMVEVPADGEIQLKAAIGLGFDANARRVVAWRK